MDKENKKYTTHLMVFGIVVIAMASVIGYLVKLNSGQQVYVIADNGRFTAKPVSADKMFQFDIKNHVKVFAKSFFEYDKYSFNQNIESALGLVDAETGKMIYKSLKDAGIYETLKDKKVRTTVKIDTLLVDMNAKPVKVKVLMRQYIYIGNAIKENPLGAIFDIVPYSRSEGNPFGQLIVNFNFINYAPFAETKNMYFKTMYDLNNDLKTLKKEANEASMEGAGNE